MAKLLSILFGVLVAAAPCFAQSYPERARKRPAPLTIARDSEAADAKASFTNGKDGVYEMATPMVIPRTRPRLRVPPSFLTVQVSSPGGELYGKDQFGTVLRFDPAIKGQLVATELYSTGTAGHFWNDGNTQGDPKLKACLCQSVHDLTIDGRAEIRPYPFGYNKSWTKPDVHGPDMPWRADGLCIEGNGFIGERIRLFQIPGTGLVIKGGKGGQGGAYGIFDAPFSRLSDISISHAINGMLVASGDAKLRNIWIDSCCKDGLMITCACVVDTDHIQGCDRDVVVTLPCELHNCYHEAARIGTHLAHGSDGTFVDGLNIGPGTCWNRGVKIESNGCTVRAIRGAVRAVSADHPDIAGVEIASGFVNDVVEGQLVVGDGSEGVIIRGRHNRLVLRGGWNATQTKSRFVRAAETITGCTIEITGHGNGGAVLDLSATKLDQVDGRGNRFVINWDESATPVIYPGGGTTYNLAAGTEITINGRLQGK
jgi:hypothetical protein